MPPTPTPTPTPGHHHHHHLLLPPNSSPTTPTATITTLLIPTLPLPNTPIPWPSQEHSLIRTFRHRRRQHPTAPTGFGAIYYGTRYVRVYREVRGPAEDPEDITRVVGSGGGHAEMVRYGFPLAQHGQHSQHHPGTTTPTTTTTTLDLTDPRQAEMLRWWGQQIPPVEEGLVERLMEEFVCWPRSPSPSPSSTSTPSCGRDADGKGIEDACRQDRSVAGVAQAQSPSPGVMGVNANANAASDESPEPETAAHDHHPLPSMFPEEDTTLEDRQCASPPYPRPPPPSMAGSPGPNGGGIGIGIGALWAGMATLSPERTTIFLRDEEEGPDAISPLIDRLDPLTPSLSVVTLRSIGSPLIALTATPSPPR
ncbi:hypothetical protein BO82DRAFT_414032 [Aspergillus uvarum CBS 121591]|uniref:Uncharacterized protein n=1 Tax=Aspergillus uvarum CBS 121591 TaxID=1448315 RepID=A0A319D314_9EURO|nr:hypothetical protein BO82DRAFT_414032 [Aspergillus uvarum CBS 121591]PYH82328.1 hypothetical protein BO82DRAFT_414032 [Aspergillus uvarum CBS 121591]